MKCARDAYDRAAHGEKDTGGASAKAYRFLMRALRARFKGVLEFDASKSTDTPAKV